MTPSGPPTSGSVAPSSTKCADLIRVVGGEGGPDDRAVAVAEVVEPILAERHADRLEVGGRVRAGQVRRPVRPCCRAQSAMNSGAVEIGVVTAVDRRDRRADPARVPAHDVVGAQDVGRHARPDPPRRVEARTARATRVHHERAPARAGGRVPRQRERDRREVGAGIERVHRHVERRAFPAGRAEERRRRDAEGRARPPRERGRIDRRRPESVAGSVDGGPDGSLSDAVGRVGVAGSAFGSAIGDPGALLDRHVDTRRARRKERSRDDEPPTVDRDRTEPHVDSVTIKRCSRGRASPR